MLMRVGQVSRPFRETYTAAVSTGAGGDYGAAIAPYLSLIGQEASYQALFAQYKVHSVDVQWIPLYQPATATGGLKNSFTYIVYDPTSNSAPSSASNLLNYSSCQMVPTFRPWKRRFKPQVFRDLDDTAFGTIPCPWVDIGNVSLAQHGLLIYMENTGVVSGPIGQFAISFNFSCRSQN